MAEEKKKVSLRKEAKTSRTAKEKPEEQTKKKTWWVQIRLFPIWLRILLVLAFLAGAAALGVMVGYGIIGDGEPKDALKLETWKHILDIISGKSEE